MAAQSLPSSGSTGDRVERSCDAADLVMIHRFIRTMLADAVALVASAPDGDRRRAGVLAAHIRQVTDVLHSHHHGEDVFVWDDLEQRAPACGLHVAQMRAQHLAITELATGVNDALAPWAESGSRADAESLLEALIALNSTLVEHLGQEEEQIIPLASVNFTQREWDRLAEHGRASVPKSWIFPQLGYMLDTMPQPDRDRLLATLPAPVRVLWAVVGQRVYRRDRARVYAAA